MKKNCFYYQHHATSLLFSCNCCHAIFYQIFSCCHSELIVYKKWFPFFIPRNLTIKVSTKSLNWFFVIPFFWLLIFNVRSNTYPSISAPSLYLRVDIGILFLCSLKKFLFRNLSWFLVLTHISFKFLILWQVTEKIFMTPPLPNWFIGVDPNSIIFSNNIVLVI